MPVRVCDALGACSLEESFFSSTNFMSAAQATIVRAFGLGTGAWALWLDLDKKMTGELEIGGHLGMQSVSAWQMALGTPIESLVSSQPCGCLTSPRRIQCAGRNAKEIMIPKIEVSGLGDYTHNVGYKTDAITYEHKTHGRNYDRPLASASSASSARPTL